MGKNKYADQAGPQRELDFHQFGPLTEQEIKQKAEQFLLDAKNDGLQKVLIITGKGIHSVGGQAVVRPVLQNFLPHLGLVKQVYQARRDRGGAGALEVVLS